MEWIALFMAGYCEVIGVFMLNLFNQNKTIRNASAMALSFVSSFALLSYAMKTLPMGLTYAIWTGIGGVGGTLVGMFLFGESKEWKRIGFIAVIMVSVIGLKVSV